MVCSFIYGIFGYNSKRHSPISIQLLFDNIRWEHSQQSVIFLFKPVSLLMKNDEVENYLILKQKYLVVEGIFAKREDEEE